MARYGLYVNDIVQNYFATEDLAMKWAQHNNLMRPGDEDEGGPSCGVLGDGVVIRDEMSPERNADE